jgi:hypothetical protein
MNDSNISIDEIPKTGNSNRVGLCSDREYLKVIRAEHKRFTHTVPLNDHAPSAGPEIKLYRRRKGTDLKPWFIVRLLKDRIEIFDSLEKKADHQKSDNHNHNSKVRSISDTYMR